MNKIGLSFMFIIALIMLTLVTVQALGLRNPHNPQVTPLENVAERLRSPGWTTLTFEGVGDMNPVGLHGFADFAWTWLAAVDSDAGGCCGIANEPSPDTVAMLWDAPLTPADTRISFSQPVEAISFYYLLNTDFGTPSIVFYDEENIELGSFLLDNCGAIPCGNTCTGDPTGGYCHFEFVGFVSQPEIEIAYLEFENASGVFGQFAIDDLSVFVSQPVFGDGFESGDTSLWSETIGQAPTPTVTPTPTDTPTTTSTATPTPTTTNTPTVTNTPTPSATPSSPECSNIEVSELYVRTADDLRIDTVRNNNSVNTLVHKETTLSWQNTNTGVQFNIMRLNIDDVNTTIHPGNTTVSPVTGTVDIDIPASSFARFDADFNRADPCLYGDFGVVFSFEYPDLGVSCIVTRETSMAIPTQTPTHTLTPTP